MHIANCSKNIVTSYGRYEILYGSLTLPLLNETVKKRLQLPASYFDSDYNLTSYRRRKKKVKNSFLPSSFYCSCFFTRVLSKKKKKKMLLFNCCCSTVAWINFLHSIFTFLIEALFLYVFFNFFIFMLARFLFEIVPVNAKIAILESTLCGERRTMKCVNGYAEHVGELWESLSRWCLFLFLF